MSRSMKSAAWPVFKASARLRIQLGAPGSPGDTVSDLEVRAASEQRVRLGRRPAISSRSAAVDRQVSGEGKASPYPGSHALVSHGGAGVGQLPVRALVDQAERDGCLRLRPPLQVGDLRPH